MIRSRAAAMVSRYRIALALLGVAYASTFHVAAQRGVVTTASPLDGLSPSLAAAFSAGARTFVKRYTIADGLGPVFNDDSCANCHRAPAIGGASTRLVTRFGRDADGVFDPLIELGGPSMQTRGIGTVTTPTGSLTFTGERIPVDATVVAHRRSTGLQGLGLVDAVRDDTVVRDRRRRSRKRSVNGRPPGTRSRSRDAATGGRQVRMESAGADAAPVRRRRARQRERHHATPISPRRTVRPATARSSISTRRRR